MNRNSVARALMAHDEDDLLGRVPALTDDELRRIGALSSKGLMVRGPKGRLHSIGATKATALAAVEVLEGEPRELLRAEMERRGPAAEAEVLQRLGLL